MIAIVANGNETFGSSCGIRTYRGGEAGGYFNTVCFGWQNFTTVLAIKDLRKRFSGKISPVFENRKTCPIYFSSMKNTA